MQHQRDRLRGVAPASHVGADADAIGKRSYAAVAAVDGEVADDLTSDIHNHEAEIVAIGSAGRLLFRPTTNRVRRLGERNVVQVARLFVVVVPGAISLPVVRLERSQADELAAPDA